MWDNYVKFTSIKLNTWYIIKTSSLFTMSVICQKSDQKSFIWYLIYRCEFYISIGKSMLTSDKIYRIASNDFNRVKYFNFVLKDLINLFECNLLRVFFNRIAQFFAVLSFLLLYSVYKTWGTCTRPSKKNWNMSLCVGGNFIYAF